MTATGDVLEVGPGTGVLTQYLLERTDINLKMIEIDKESVDYLLGHFPQADGRLIEGDFLRLKMEDIFPEKFSVIGNFPYNISSQIFFKILEYKNSVPLVVCMIQKEVAERIAEKPGTKTYGILSVFLQAWYDIEYLFTVGEGAFNPPPKVKSSVIRLTRLAETLDCRKGRPGRMEPGRNGRFHVRPGIRAPSGKARGGRLRRAHAETVVGFHCYFLFGLE